MQGIPKKIVDSELFTPGDDNNTQQQDITSGPIFVPFCDILHPFFFGNFPLKNVHSQACFTHQMCYYSLVSIHRTGQRSMIHTYIQLLGVWGVRGTFFRGKLPKINAIFHKREQKLALKCYPVVEYCYHLRG